MAKIEILSRIEISEPTMSEGIPYVKGKWVFLRPAVNSEKSPKLGDRSYPMMPSAYIPIIISETERLPKNTKCLVYNSVSKTIEEYYSTEALSIDKIYLVIALSQNLSEQQCQMLRAEEVTEGEVVFVECEEKGFCQNGVECGCSFDSYKTCYKGWYQIKLNEKDCVSLIPFQYFNLKNK